MQMASSRYSRSINNHYSTLDLNLPQVTFAAPGKRRAGLRIGVSLLCDSVKQSFAALPACSPSRRQYAEVESGRRRRVHYCVISVCF